MKRSRLRLEFLEDRRLLSTFTVTNSLDSGTGSLRQAILDVNANPGLDTIAFDLEKSTSLTIQPLSALPTITNPVVIDGTSQPGYKGQPLIELDGSDAGMNTVGLRIQAGGSTVRGLVINRFGNHGISLEIHGGDVIQGNYVGTDAAGMNALGNGLGVDVTTSANPIGGSLPGQGNVISSNRVDGMRLEQNATLNCVLGNLIGTDAGGTLSLAPAGSNNGVVITGAFNTIGGTDPGARNIISGNHQQGIFVNGPGAMGNLVQGNFIGTDISGAFEVSNGLRGITVANGAHDNIFGGTDPGAGNTLSGNLQNGIELTGAGTSANVVQGNFIGTDATGTTALPNHLRGVGISYGANQNTIGGTTHGSRNIISGNMQNGVLLDASTDANVVQGNYIGTDITGSVAIANNLEGVLIGKTSVAGPITHNLIGGTSPGAGNVISGNRNEGVRIKDDMTSGNLVQGNLIGTDATGSFAIPNGNQGVLILQSAHDNTIGGTDVNAGNVISGNIKQGIEIKDDGTTGNVVLGNFIGTDVTGVAPLGNARDGIHIVNASNNTVGGAALAAGNIVANNNGDGVLVDHGVGNSIQGNAIFSHTGLGIRLINGGNNNQAFPVITSATSDDTGTAVEGTVQSAPNSIFFLEFFDNRVCNPSGFSEGEIWLGVSTVSTDDTGKASFSIFFAIPADPGSFLTATATSPTGDTSPFSQCVEVTAPGSPGRPGTWKSSGHNPFEELADFVRLTRGICERAPARFTETYSRGTAPSVTDLVFQTTAIDFEDERLNSLLICHRNRGLLRHFWENFWDPDLSISRVEEFA